MADLERSLVLAKAKFEEALYRASRRFKNITLDLEGQKIPFPENQLLKAALLLSVRRYHDLLSAIGIPYFLDLAPYPLFKMHTSHLEFFPHLQKRTLFYTFFYAAIAEAIELLLDETEGKKSSAVETLLRPHLFLEEMAPLTDPHLGLAKLEEARVIQLVDGIISEKELEAITKRLHQDLAENLEAQMRKLPSVSQFESLLKQIGDLGPEAKGQALWTLGRKELRKQQ